MLATDRLIIARSNLLETGPRQSFISIPHIQQMICKLAVVDLRMQTVQSCIDSYRSRWTGADHSHD